MYILRINFHFFSRCLSFIRFSLSSKFSEVFSSSYSSAYDRTFKTYEYNWMRKRMKKTKVTWMIMPAVFFFIKYENSKDSSCFFACLKVFIEKNKKKKETESKEKIDICIEPTSYHGYTTEYGKNATTFSLSLKFFKNLTKGEIKNKWIDAYVKLNISFVYNFSVILCLITKNIYHCVPKENIQQNSCEQKIHFLREVSIFHHNKRTNISVQMYYEGIFCNAIITQLEKKSDLVIALVHYYLTSEYKSAAFFLIKEYRIKI